MNRPQIRPGRTRTRSGIAVSADRIHFAVAHPDGARVSSVTVPGGVVAADRDVLAAAFAELLSRASESGAPVTARVSIALLPPLADVKLVDLPPLRPGEATRLVARGWRRYFIGLDEDRVIAAADRPKDRGGPALAAAASASLVDALREAAGAAGWRVGRVVTAQAAWGAGAREAGATMIALSFEGTVYTIVLDERGMPRALRRRPADETEPGVEEHGARPLTGSAGDGSGEGPSGGGVGRAGMVGAADPEAFAALHAASAEPALETTAAIRSRRTEGVRSLARFATAALLLVVAAGTLELWGARRELNAITAQRRALGETLPALVELSDSLATVEARRARIRELAATGTPVTPVLLDLASHLPGDAYLASLRSRADTLTMDVAGGTAARALAELQDAASLANVRLNGGVIRELREGSRPVERFTVDALIIPPAATPTSGESEVKP